ncbi:MAG TPA: SH3 domain-containing protein [Desulfatirhabdiaceae bacterium]|nr:SH3 domain-containing protein [Desulfatirhabdiaceae bacterium]
MSTPHRKTAMAKYGMIVLLILSGFLIFHPLLSAGQNTVMYIHSVKAPVYADSNNQSEKIMELKTGEKIHVLEEKGFWYLIAHGEKTGWIFKLMVRDKPPADFREINVNQMAELESKARKRPSAYTTTASARGLKAKRDRFAGQYKNDYYALEQLESMVIPVEEADKFIADGMNNEKKQ